MGRVMGKIIATLGIITAMAGAGLFFFFGPPGVQPAGAATFVATVTRAMRRRERWGNSLSWTGLILGIVGGAAQVAAVWL